MKKIVLLILLILLFFSVGILFFKVNYQNKNEGQENIFTTSDIVNKISLSNDWFVDSSIFYNREGQQKGKIIILKINPKNVELSLDYSSDNPKPVSAWQKSQDEIIINGGYFHEDYSSSGFLVVNNKIISSRMFDQDRSGLFFIDENNNFGIRDLTDEPIQKDEKFLHAMQSYPFLIKNNKLAIKEDSGLKARRTAIGVDVLGNLYVIIVPTSDLSLFKLAENLASSDISFTNVLNLDGGPSTGLFVEENQDYFEINSLYSVPGIIRIKKIAS